MRWKLTFIAFVALLVSLGGCSKLGKLDVNVSDGKSSDANPVIQAIDPEHPQKGDLVTLKGNNFKGSSLDGILVFSDSSQRKVTITVTGSGEGTFHLDEELPRETSISQVLIVKKNEVLTTFNIPVPSNVATPTFSVPAGAYGPAQSIELATTTEDAEIFYTLDGKEPDNSSAQKYQNPISVNQSLTIKAIAVKSGKKASAVASATYTINGAVASPVASLPAGLYSNNQTVTLTTTTEGATILYTTDGSTPGNSASVYTGPLTLSGNTTLKAIAIKTGYSASTVLSVSYAFKATMPTASVTGNFYTSLQSVTLTTATTGASIYYTTDGSTPSVSSTLYSGAISIVGNKTLQAIAVKSGYTTSNILLEDYMVILQLVPSSAANSDGSNLSVTALTNGNIVVARPYADIGGVSNTGSVSLYNGTTGVLISTITGSTAGDAVGGSITALSNGNFVIRSSDWDCQAALGCSGTITDVGAVTWVNGTTGLSAAAPGEILFGLSQGA